MLDDDDGGFVKLADQLPAGVEVDEIVVAEFFASKLEGGGYAFAGAVGVESGALVRVLAVTQHLAFLNALFEYRKLFILVKIFKYGSIVV